MSWTWIRGINIINNNKILHLVRLTGISINYHLFRFEVCRQGQIQEKAKTRSTRLTGKKGRNCEPCKKKNKVRMATLFCKNCKQYQCDVCSNAHEIFDFMSGHDIAKAEEALTLKPVFDMKRLDKCKYHDETLRFYCIDERKLCCSTCAIASHRGCAEVNEISREARKHSIDTSGVESTIKELQETADNLYKLLQTTKLNTSGKLEAVLDYIDGLKKTLVCKFDQLKETLIVQFQSAKDQLMEQVNTSMAVTKDITGALLEKKGMLMSSKTFGTPEQHFIASNIIQDQITPFTESLESKRASLYNLDCSFECSKQLTELLEANFSIATISVDKIPIDSLMSHKESVVQLQLMTFVNLKQGEQDTKEPLYSGMDFFSDGRMAVVDNQNWKLYIMDEDLERKGMFKFSDYRYDVCVLSEEEVAVTSGRVYLLEFLNVSKTYDITLTRTVKTTAKYVSICLMNETTFLVSTYDDKRSLRMITLTGEEKDFDPLPEKQYKIDNSNSTYIRNKDIAVLTDMNEDTVYMYDVRKKGLPRRVVKHDDIKEPKRVCVGPDDCLFVCSQYTHSIVQVSPSGKVVATHKLDLKYPRTVCVSKDGRKMAVSNCATGNQKLQLFNIHN